jgi:catechol 2,3-dioxygenase-like lactoylglutathione lyase family enzyme
MDGGITRRALALDDGWPHPGLVTKDVQITIDCSDPAALAAFWAQALGYQVQPPPDGFDSWEAALTAFGVPPDQWNSRSAILPLEGPHPRIFFQRVPEGKAGKNRVHLDVRAAPGLEGEERMRTLETEAVRLAALGATRVLRVEPAPATMDAGHITMRDPEGNEFCLD